MDPKFLEAVAEARVRATRFRTCLGPLLRLFGLGSSAVFCCQCLLLLQEVLCFDDSL